MIAVTYFSLLIVLLGFNGAVAVEAGDGTLLSSHRDLQEQTFGFGYVEPAWYDRIASEFTGENLRRCIKRNPNGGRAAPVTGQVCSASTKTCFFGTQECPEVGPHPVFQCTCDGAAGSQTWSCPSLPCPVGCPPDGVGFEIFNDAACPATFAGDTCTAAIDGLQCYFGRNDCCGTCNSNQRFTCNFGPEPAWVGTISNACLTECQCPAVEERTTAACYTEGQQCDYDYPTTLPGAICNAKDTCTCTTAGTYSCERTFLECVSDDPPQIDP